MRPSSITRLVLAIAGLAVSAGLAWACVGVLYGPSWALANPRYDPVGRPVLSPGNDTRINLLLLARSLAGRSIGAGAHTPTKRSDVTGYPDYDFDDLGESFFSWPGLRQTYWPQAQPGNAEGAYSAPDACQASAQAADSLSAALAVEANVPEADRQRILKRRATLECANPEPPSPTQSAIGQDYMAYLNAARDFYNGDWDRARTGFAALRHARSAWVAETAAYMPIRIALRAAIEDAVDRYGGFDPEKVDREEVETARAAIADYLKRYPQGRYAQSARDFTRRVYWLSGETEALARTYEAALHKVAPEDPAIADLIDEIDNHIFMNDNALAVVGSIKDAPMLQTVADLMRMRVDETGKPMTLTGDELEAQAGTFAFSPDLFGFLRATRAWYAGQDPSAVLDLTRPGAGPAGRTSLDFSRAVLRGLALAKRGDPEEAAYWTATLRNDDALFEQPFAQMGLAIRWQNDGRLDKIFAADSPVQDRRIREVLLENVAPPAILRKVAHDATRSRHERETAQYALLANDLMRGAYASFVADVAVVAPDARRGAWERDDRGYIASPVGKFAAGTWSDGFACPEIKRTAAVLARAPNDARALLCLGDFYRLNQLDGFGREDFDKRNATPARRHETLGWGPDLFPGRPRYRADFYSAIIADPRATPELRAYALYRAVRCYAPSGYNSCSAGSSDPANNVDVPLAQRRAWFLELKAKYPESRWAKALHFYW